MSRKACMRKIRPFAVDLRDTRKHKRTKLLAIEQKRWFWIVLYISSFLAFAAGSYYITTGSFRLPININNLCAAGLSGLLAIVLCFCVKKARQKEFELLRAQNRYLRTERELERFIIVVLRGIRLPVKNIRTNSKNLAAQCKEFSRTVHQQNIPKDALTPWLGLENGNGSADGTLINHARQIYKDAARLDIFPRGLLKIGKIRNASPKKQWIDMNSLIVELVNDLDELIKWANAQIQMKDLPPCLADKELIYDMFYQLLHNAIRYLAKQRQGIVRIWAQQQKNSIMYFIEDNGIGIETEDFEKIFEMFYRAVPSNTVSEGLGLAIVRKIVQLHNGRLWVKSKPGQGTTFTVAIPLK